MYQVQSLLSHPWILYPLLIWALFWKGTALWRAARLTYAGWFIALLIINTLGVFEIIFIIATARSYRERFF